MPGKYPYEQNQQNISQCVQGIHGLDKIADLDADVMLFSLIF